MKKVLFTLPLLLVACSPFVSLAQCPSQVTVEKISCGSGQRFKVTYTSTSSGHASVKAWCGNCIEKCIVLDDGSGSHTEYSDCFPACNEPIQYQVYPSSNCHGSPCTPLPLTFLSFAATPEDRKVKLQWKVESSNLGANSNFQVERSYNGTDFISIATVFADETISDYQFTDEDEPAGKKVFYRILFVENEKGKYSPLRMVSFEKFVTTIKTFIAGRSLFFEGMPTGTATASIYDMNGKLLKTVTVTQTTPADVSALTKGMYIVSLLSKGETIYSGKFLL